MYVALYEVRFGGFARSAAAPPGSPALMVSSRQRRELNPRAPQH